ncbi:response regulator [Desulfogranum japonicum]|uniref:response regulator n=1 Tax=Desulfogranum japonicum TaxID=231447 RepID=UPI000402357C|nr:response regulator [Desulfogranum japonicum]
MQDPKNKVIDGFSLENILQISSLENKSQTMRISTIDRLGYLYLENGDLINARCGELNGYDAAIEILCWDNVQIQISELNEHVRNIDVSLMKILLKAGKIRDDRQSEIHEQGIDLLDQAIEDAESLQYKKAHQNLVLYLKKHKDNVAGWIWYSRIHSKLDVMKKALDVAYRISPNDPFVIEERDKYFTSVERLTGGKIRKCLFCWTALDIKTHQCHHCKGFLNISRQALEAKVQNPAPFKTAVTRYTKVSQKLPSFAAAHYCLSLAYLNLGNFTQALHHLDKVTKLEPHKTVFADQLSLFMNFMASKVDTETVVEEVETNKASNIPDNREGRATSAALPAAKKTVLVVEDSSTVRKVISIALGRNGYEILEAVDGLEALSRMSEQRPDLILLDVVLPKMDGFKILSIMKSNNDFKDIPVIMLTSKDGFINKVKGKMAGADAYLTKPFDPKKMISEIEKYI